eukprot:m.114178 g.114178  ORF g.114178 m.114178 type:complete len:977 (+) comp9152_c1_seq1:83-3013(+)
MAAMLKFKLLQQTLNVAIDLPSHSLRGETTLLIAPIADSKRLADLSLPRRIGINAHRGINISSITIEDAQIEFSRAKLPEGPIAAAATTVELRRAVLQFHRKAAEGEVAFDLPLSALQPSDDPNVMRSVVVKIEFEVQHPAGGLCFVGPDARTPDRPAHAFTTGGLASARAWFPCIDVAWQRCHWELAVTVSADLTAVASGLLAEQTTHADGRRTFHYTVPKPTAAMHIGLAVGPFMAWPDPVIPYVTHFCLPGLLAHLQHSTTIYSKFLNIALDALRLDRKLPFVSHYLVFVDCAEPLASFSSISVMSHLLLHSARMIDPSLETRRHLSQAIAMQLLTHHIAPRAGEDSWIIEGAVMYIVGECMRRTLGENEARYWAQKEMDEVCDMDKNQFPLYCTQSATQTPPLPAEHVSAFARRKAGVVMRMLEHRIGHDPFAEVLHKLVLLPGGPAAFAGDTTWDVLSAEIKSNQAFIDYGLVSTAQFFALVQSVGHMEQDTFRANWVDRSGFAQLQVRYDFQSTSNMLRVEITQTGPVFTGTLHVGVQDVDRFVAHKVNVTSASTILTHEITVKNRRTKKKKVIIENSDEIDVDLSECPEPASPVMWVTVDPEQAWLRRITMVDVQPKSWDLQALYERNVAAQAEATWQLRNFSQTGALKKLADAEQTYYEVRLRALRAIALCKQMDGPGEYLMGYFRKLFFLSNEENIVRSNDSSQLLDYYLQKAIPGYLAEVRDSEGACPEPVISFLLHLYTYNDNTGNQADDVFYVASLLRALAVSFQPSTSSASQHHPISSTRRQLLAQVLQAITLTMSSDKLVPSRHFVLTSACLHALATLWNYHLIPPQLDILEAHAGEANLTPVRQTAITLLAELFAGTKTESKRIWAILFPMAMSPAADRFIRLHILSCLSVLPQHAFERVPEARFSVLSEARKPENLVDQALHALLIRVAEQASSATVKRSVDSNPLKMSLPLKLGGTPRH